MVKIDDVKVGDKVRFWLEADVLKVDPTSADEPLTVRLDDETSDQVWFISGRFSYC